MMRRSVDLPQPDGPTSTVKEPSGTVSVMSGMTVSLPKDLVTWFRRTSAMGSGPPIHHFAS